MDAIQFLIDYRFLVGFMVGGTVAGTFAWAIAYGRGHHDGYHEAIADYVGINRRYPGKETLTP